MVRGAQRAIEHLVRAGSSPQTRAQPFRVAEGLSHPIANVCVMAIEGANRARVAGGMFLDRRVDSAMERRCAISSSDREGRSGRPGRRR